MATEEQTNTGIAMLGMASGSSVRAGQRLTITNRVLTKLSFPLRKNDSPTGMVTFTIRKVSDSSVIATNDFGDASTLSATLNWEEVTFDTPVLIDEEVRILVEFSGGGGSDNVTFYATTTSVKAGESLTGYTTFWRDYDNGGTDYDGAYIYTYDTATAPTVTTQGVTSISGTTATGNGNITDLGSPDPTAHGVCWKTYAAYESDGILPLTSDSSTDEGAASATGAFTSTMSGLAAGTKYILRAYATNSAGTSYGNAVEFTANKGTVFPDPDTDPLRRVSGIRRTFWSGIGGESVYQATLSLGGTSTTYISLISERKSPNAIAPTLLPTGAGFQQSDYEAWLRKMDIDTIPMIFGHFPTYAEWVNWIRFGKAKK